MAVWKPYFETVKISLDFFLCLAICIETAFNHTKYDLRPAGQRPLSPRKRV